MLRLGLADAVHDQPLGRAAVPQRGQRGDLARPPGDEAIAEHAANRAAKRCVQLSGDAGEPPRPLGNLDDERVGLLLDKIACDRAHFHDRLRSLLEVGPEVSPVRLSIGLDAGEHSQHASARQGAQHVCEVMLRFEPVQ